MKRTSIKSFIIAGIVALSIAGLLAYVCGYAAKPEDMASIPQLNDPPANTGFDLYSHISNINPQQLKEQFPYQLYLDSADRYHFSSIQAHITAMDSVNPGNRMGNLEILSIALTEKLKDKTGKTFQSYNGDSLLVLMQWAEKFNSYADADPENGILFNSIYTYWLDFIANKLNKYYEQDQTLKYASKFNYLATRCYERKFSVPVNNSRFEKIIQYFSETQFAYLYNRFWNGTGAMFKTGILLVVMITLYAYGLLIRRIFIYFKNK